MSKTDKTRPYNVQLKDPYNNRYARSWNGRVYLLGNRWFNHPKSLKYVTNKNERSERQKLRTWTRKVLKDFEIEEIRPYKTKSRAKYDIL